MVKMDEIQKLEKQLAKKESDKQRYEVRMESDKQKVKELNDEITLLQAKIITENLTRQNMTFHELKEMLIQQYN